MTTSLGPREVARSTGVSTDTLRHYERSGLLPRVERTAAGYRRYSPSAVDRVLLIQRALAIGFSLKELKRVLSVRDQGGAPCRAVRALVGERLAALGSRIEELSALRDDLAGLLTDWDQRLENTVNGERAHLLDSLGEHPRLKEPRLTSRAAGGIQRRDR